MPIDSPTGDPVAETIDRFDTAVRALMTVLFFVIARVVEIVLAVVIVFGVLYTLITQEEPAPGVKRFSERVLAYLVQIVRYLSYNGEEAPFPFRDFPPEEA
ncbi:MAG: DUF4389 domain-containing protein [Myxococcales bacterium]|nr:DUF4389 domain-containing protein [Myxococcales bacterium]